MAGTVIGKITNGTFTPNENYGKTAGTIGLTNSAKSVNSNGRTAFNNGMQTYNTEIAKQNNTTPTTEKETELDWSNLLNSLDLAYEQANYANSLSANSAREAMEFSAQQAQLNREWQEKMSNTAYQRAVEDMKAAGINPILAYSQGGATTPSGSTGSGYTYSGQQAQLNSDIAMLGYLAQLIQAFASASKDGANSGGVLSTLSTIANKVSNGLKKQALDYWNQEQEQKKNGTYKKKWKDYVGEFLAY